MKMYAWSIVGFRKLEDGTITFGEYLYWSQANNMELVIEIINQAKLDNFPVAAGWFEHYHNIIEIPTGATQ